MHFSSHFLGWRFSELFESVGFTVFTKFGKFSAVLSFHFLSCFLPPPLPPPVLCDSSAMHVRMPKVVLQFCDALLMSWLSFYFILNCFYCCILKFISIFSARSNLIFILSCVCVLISQCVFYL